VVGRPKRGGFQVHPVQGRGGHLVPGSVVRVIAVIPCLPLSACTDEPTPSQPPPSNGLLNSMAFAWIQRYWWNVHSLQSIRNGRGEGVVMD